MAIQRYVYETNSSKDNMDCSRNNKQYNFLYVDLENNKFYKNFNQLMFDEDE